MGFKFSRVLPPVTFVTPLPMEYFLFLYEETEVQRDQELVQGHTAWGHPARGCTEAFPLTGRFRRPSRTPFSFTTSHRLPAARSQAVLHDAAYEIASLLLVCSLIHSSHAGRKANLDQQQQNQQEQRDQVRRRVGGGERKREQGRHTPGRLEQSLWPLTHNRLPQ